MDYLGKGEMLTNRDVNQFAHNLRENAYGKILVYLISAHETWDQHYTCCILYLFSVIWVLFILTAPNMLSQVKSQQRKEEDDEEEEEGEHVDGDDDGDSVNGDEDS